MYNANLGQSCDKDSALPQLHQKVGKPVDAVEGYKQAKDQEGCGKEIRISREGGRRMGHRSRAYCSLDHVKAVFLV